MKILFLINEFERGGAERVVSYLLHHLPIIYPELIPVLYILEKSTLAYPIPAKTEIHIASKYHSRNILKFIKLPLIALQLKRFIKKNNIMVVISFLSRANYTNILATYYGSAHYAIISERNTPSLIYRSKSNTDIVNHFLIRKLYPLSRAIIAVSKGVQKDLVEEFRIPANKISVIYNPYDIHDIRQKTRERLKHKWFENKTLKTIITVGSLVKYKNHSILIQAFKEVVEVLPHARLFIIGKGPEKNRLIHLASKLNLTEKIEFTGELENPFTYIGKADLFVLSSKTEGFPNVLVEAMICGCPVISTNCQSGPDEIIIDGVNGLLVPVGNIKALSNAIMSILENDQIIKEFKKNSEKTIQNFEITKIVKQYYAMILQKTYDNNN